MYVCTALSNGQVMHLAPGQRVVIPGGTVYTLGQQGGAPPTAAPPQQLSLEDLKPIGTNSVCVVLLVDCFDMF